MFVQSNQISQVDNEIYWTLMLFLLSLNNITHHKYNTFLLKKQSHFPLKIKMQIQQKTPSHRFRINDFFIWQIDKFIEFDIGVIQ